MASILLAYATNEGQTGKIAGSIADTLEELGHAVTTVDVAGNGHDIPAEYDAAILGASIHAGKHQTDLGDFARQNRDTLAARPGGFFQVCLSAASSDEARRSEVDDYLENFVTRTEWDPDLTATFAGAIRYSAYGFLKRMMMKRIARDATGDTDTERDYEYTDWEQVEAFAREFASLVEKARSEADSDPDRPVSA